MAAPTLNLAIIVFLLMIAGVLLYEFLPERNVPQQYERERFQTACKRVGFNEQQCLFFACGTDYEKGKKCIGLTETGAGADGDVQGTLIVKEYYEAPRPRQ